MTRINTRLAATTLAALAAVVAVATAQGDYNCENIAIDGATYNIAVLKPT